MPGDVEPAKALRTLYPGVSVKTCLLKEVPTLLELERQLVMMIWRRSGTIIEERYFFLSFICCTH